MSDAVANGPEATRMRLAGVLGSGVQVWQLLVCSAAFGCLSSVATLMLMQREVRTAKLTVKGQQGPSITARADENGARIMVGSGSSRSR